MGFRLNVTGGAQQVALREKSIKNVVFGSESSPDSNARATDFGVSMKVWGKMLYQLGGEGSDDTLELSKWSLVPSERADCYRNVTVEVVSAGQVVRKYEVPNAFVMEYSEEVDDETGVGTFYMHIKQKKDENDKVKIEGGYAGE
ncbi:MAG: hypothetical protein HDQ98_00375 [Lachnospiraceae bacterium]|nr:hypothetical protein [Lachnospiraceae bacterium]